MGTLLAHHASGFVWPDDGKEARRRPVGRWRLVAADESLPCGGIAEPGLAIGTDSGGELMVVEHERSVRSRAVSPHRVTCVFVGLSATRYVADVTPRHDGVQPVRTSPIG